MAAVSRLVLQALDIRARDHLPSSTEAIVSDNRARCRYNMDDIAIIRTNSR